MKHRFKGLVAVLATAALVLGLTPVSAFAVERSPITVNGERIMEVADNPAFEVISSGELVVLVILQNDAVISSDGQEDRIVDRIVTGENVTSFTIEDLQMQNGGLYFGYGDMPGNFTLNVKGRNVINNAEEYNTLNTYGNLDIYGQGSDASLSLVADDSRWVTNDINSGLRVFDLDRLEITGSVGIAYLDITDINNLTINGIVYTLTRFGIWGSTSGSINNSGQPSPTTVAVWGRIDASWDDNTGFFVDLDAGNSVTIDGENTNGMAVMSQPGIFLGENTRILTPSGGQIAEYLYNMDSFSSFFDAQGNRAGYVVLSGTSEEEDTGREYLVEPVKTGNETAPVNGTAPTNATVPTNTTVPEPAAEIHEAFLFGLEDGTFQPEANLTRGQAASIFAQLAGDFATAETPSAFTDLADKWYASYVDFLNEKGVLADQQAETYRGDENMTRAEFCNLAAKTFGWTDAAADAFNDVDENTPYATSILAAYGAGFITGDGDGNFRPNDSITRQEVASLLNRALNRQADKDYIIANLANLKTFSDVTVYDEAAQTGNWGYWDILEAANAHSYTRSEETSTEVWAPLP